VSLRIALIDGHPDPDATRFGHAVADGDAAGAEQGGLLKSLKRNILALVGISPTRETLIGNIEGIGATGRGRMAEPGPATRRAGQLNE
jgi:hypothetical protein